MELPKILTLGPQYPGLIAGQGLRSEVAVAVQYALAPRSLRIIDGYSISSQV